MFSSLQKSPAKRLKHAKSVMMEKHLIGRNIRDPRVLQAMDSIPREKFIAPQLERAAYDDNPLSIGFDQTISQPYIVALMIEWLELKETDTVLEIGAGCGYQAALLSLLSMYVYALEIVPELADGAGQRLKKLGYNNVTVINRDGSEGLAEHAPYDKIISAAAPKTTPAVLEDQLADGGVIVIPRGDAVYQELVRGDKHDGEIKYRHITAVRFVPMTGSAQNSV